MERIKKVVVIAAIGIIFAANGQIAGNDFNSARTQKIGEQTNFCAWNNDQSIKWTGQREKWVRGSGTKEDPFLIEKPEHLAWLSHCVKNGEGAIGNVVFNGVYFRLMINIDLNGSEWTPIGYRMKDSWHYFFGGHFDGNGHTISGLFINCKDEWLGLFGGVKDGSVTCLKVSGKIERKDPPPSAPIPQIPPPIPTHRDPWAGSIVAYAENAIIQNCYSECAIYLENTHPTYVGGIAGACTGIGGISFCGNIGNITAVSAGRIIYLGGIVGYTTTTVSNSYNTGNIISVSDELSDICCRGGIAGYSAADIIDCYNTGTISGNCDAQRFSGGIVAVALDNTIKNCYNAGTITDTKGGVIVGKQNNSNVNVSNCYYRNISGGNNSLGGISKTEDFMKTIQMVELLGSAFWQDDMPYFNQGYPILFNKATTGITEFTSSDKVTIYPNPVRNQLKIKNYELRNITDYVIYNIMGQIVMQGKSDATSTINVESLANGVYYLKITDKFVKFVKE